MYRIFSVFTEPYPLEDDHKKQLLVNVLVSGFVVLFLAIFQPFGLSEINWPWYKILPVYLGYGIITFLIILITEKLIKPAFPMFFDEQDWNVGKNIIWLVFTIMLIGLGNLFYSSLLGFTGISGSTLLSFQLYTIGIAIFPVTVITLLKRIQFLNRNLKEVKKINEDLLKPIQQTSEEQPITFVSENGKETIRLTPDQFLFAESADNYSDIVYTENSIVRRAMLRSSLRRFEEQNTNAYIYKVHRSYLVNLRKISRVEGNSQGYRLFFENIDESVPVARRCSLHVKHLIAQIHGQ
jgi:hypothetical protein